MTHRGPRQVAHTWTARWLFALLGVLPALGAVPARAQNAIVTENQLAGNPASAWDISGAGDLTLQGFATDISVNRGDTVHFKIKSDAAAYHIDIYRLGFYQGNGARLVGTGVVTATLPQAQPADLYDPATGLTDCGNWAESAHWDVPAGAVSGIYIAKLTRDDTQGASHIVFIVRDDASHSDLLFQTSDATWQAYNGYGGNSLYVGTTSFPGGHAAKVSYNRPFLTRAGGGGSSSSEDWLFNSEYPMVRWLESNGFDVTYSTGVDSDRRGNLILNHRAFLSVGHDEYWSGGQRANVQAARNAGVHLAFFSGNEIYWKTRWEPSTDGTDTPYRTLVCYKEGTLGENVCGTKCDPLAAVWTGLWRDGCPPTYAPNDACLPENALSGNISWIGSTDAIRVPDTFKNLRFWRNTEVASLGAGQTTTLPAGTLGYEWDWQQFDASYPPRRILLSTTVSGGKTHHLSLYRHSSGALVFGAGTVQWAWGLDANHDRGNDPPSAAMQQATVNLLADMGAQPATLQSGLVAASASSDALAPSSVIGFPVSGATLPSGSPVNITGTASDAGGGVVAGVEVSVDGGATWNPATGTTSWTYAWTPGAQGPVTIESRAFDDTGNLEVPGGGEGAANVVAVTVTAPAPPNCPCTVFQPTDTPASPAITDNQAIENGMKFRSSVNGYVTALRFYKGSLNTGTHLGHLWTGAGAQLAEATFSGETASGWQEVPLTSPVAITAGATYVVSVHSSGYYADTHPFFTSAVVNGPLRGLANGEDGPNGVYVYGASAFPDQTFDTSNYWVDAVFNTSVGPDVTPPTVIAISPGNGATAVATGTSVTAIFSEAIDPATVSSGTFELRDAGNALVAASVSYNGATRTATLAPSALLATSSTYSVRLAGGATDPRIKDVAGNALASDFTWSFSTAAPPPPPPTEGPGGPILVISAASNPFSRYLVEILRAEGLNEFTAMDASQVTPAALADYDVVLLGEQALSASQVTMLTDWTTAGGTLIAMRPDKQLAGLLGLTDAAATLGDRYLLVNTASGPGVGIVNQTIQYHGAADLYTLNGATSLATLYSSATTATSNPAVTMHSVGPNGGRAMAFTYDLARSVVYTRQGNPAWAGQKRDGQIEPIRSDDLFFGNAAGDPQPDWVDLTKVAIPQADEQQRLLANVILQGNLHRKPLPRFWYFPKGLKAVVVMTGDNHGDYGMAPRFDIYRNQSPPGCSVDDWECVRASGYEYVGAGFTDAQALFYHNLGFEVGVHILTNCARWTPTELEGFFADQLGVFASTFPSIPPPVSNRTHCISWSDWSTQADVSVAHGIRLDTNYYYWPPGWVQDRPGVFTGSGMPMRFARLDGSIVDCYQATTQMTDESGQSYPMTADSLLARAQDARGYYGAFTANMHFDHVPEAASDQIVASAQARGVPVVSGRQMLTWLDGRNGSSFGSIAWSGSQLSFSIAVGAGSRNLQAMLPTLAAAGALTGITRGGSPVSYTTQNIKGIEYAFFPAAAGGYVAQYQVDSTAPTISAVTATPHSDGTATVSWATNEASDSKVDYGTAPAALTLHASSAALVTSHGLTLTGLGASTTYYYRVTSADAASNAATEPNPPAPPLSFAMPAAVCFRDQTLADFGAGTLDANTSLSLTGDGEVILKPAFAAEFAGAALPADMQSNPWSAGGSATVSGGVMVVSGAAAATSASFGPGRSLEFVATFRADPFQNVGFSTGIDFNSPWVTFGTSGAGNGVYARASSPSTDILISAGLLGSPHRYRIDWNATDFVFFVDGSQVATIASTVGSAMVANASDFNLNAATLDVDWLRVTPYPGSGSFTSRVYDGSAPTNWGAATWSADLPTGTSLALEFRAGNTATPDGTWSSFGPVTNGSAVGENSRYLQYRADLATTNAGYTPALNDIAVTCAAGPDVTPPLISSVAAAPAGDGQSATITWSTQEAADSRVDYGTSAGALTSNATNGARVKTHSLLIAGLTPGATYYYRVTSADAALNAATSPDPPASLSFTTPAPTCFTDQTDADFGAGALTGTYVSATADGEVILAPASGTEFPGSTLPAGWQSAAWSGGGTATVSGGLLSVNGARAATTASFGPNRSIEFVATFQAETFQHVGLVSSFDFDPPWAIFSTSNTGTGVYARVHTGSSSSDVLISGALLGSPHRYRIDWNTSNFVFSVDGSVAATINLAVGSSMLVAASDVNSAANPLTVDWVRVTPYAGSGSFVSAVHDGGGPTNWVSASWIATVPAGTSLALSVRAGNTAAPDASWTAYQPVSSPGASLGVCGRYVQYQADLATTDPGATPALESVSLRCGPAVPVGTGLTTLAAAPGTGNDASGRLKVQLTWSGAAPGSVIQIFRKGFGDYPLFRTGVGSEPAPPASAAAALAAGWTLTGVSASGQTDQPPSRDYWYYVLYQTDACGSSSPASNRVALPGYLLGDVSDGLAACQGNNVVNGADLSLLGAHYGATLSGPGDPMACLDVGPTTDFSTHGRPQPDGAIEFEDLVMFALDYTGAPGPAAARPAAAPAAAASNALALAIPDLPGVGGTFEVVLNAAAAGNLQALSVNLGYDAAVVDLLASEPGELLGRQITPAALLSSAPGRVDVALLGAGAVLSGEGELARVRFRVRTPGDPAITIRGVDARDGSNRRVSLGALPAPPPLALPERTELGAAYPNPFAHQLSLEVSLRQAETTRLRVFDVAGRRVRTLLDGPQPAGRRLITWDGRDDLGATLRSGYYVVRLETRDRVQSRAVWLVR